MKESGFNFGDITLPEGYHGKIETDVPAKESESEEAPSTPVYSQDDDLNSEVEE